MQVQQKPCTPTQPQTTPKLMQQGFTYPTFQVRRNYTSQFAKR